MNQYEEFKIVNGYKIYSNGDIIGKRGKLLSKKTDKNGYIPSQIDLGNLGIARGQHRAVAMVFIPNPENKPEINHKNGIKHDNRAENLEWATESENGIHASYELGKRIGETYYNNILTEEQVIEIYNLCKNSSLKRKEIANMYGVNSDVVGIIVRAGRTWRYLNLEPLPPLTKGSNGKGIKKPRKLYKLTDIINNTEETFTTLNDISKRLGYSTTMVRKYSEHKAKKDLIDERYKVEQFIR